MPTPAERPSEEDMWAGPSGERWLANALRFEETLRPIGDALLTLAAPAPGEHILEIGCGAGSLALEIAPRVAPTGTVTGLDISPALITEATRRAAATQPLAPIRFITADAARSPLPPGMAHCLVSRFGSMFFTDPYSAFTHLHSLLRTSGRLALACWATLKQNPWMLEVRTILAAHFDLPTPPPRTPGPFAFDDPAYLTDILTRAHFKQIQISPWNATMHVGGPNTTPDSAAGFLLSALSMAQRATDAPEPIRNQVRKELITCLHAFLTPTGVQMPASVWLISARA